jgi:hypothetical protein
MTYTTRAQRLAIRRTYERSADGAPDYRAFRRRVIPPAPVASCFPGAACGLGIEPDGYTHS